MKSGRRNERARGQIIRLKRGRSRDRVGVFSVGDHWERDGVRRGGRGGAERLRSGSPGGRNNQVEFAMLQDNRLPKCEKFAGDDTLQRCAHAPPLFVFHQRPSHSLGRDAKRGFFSLRVASGRKGAR